MDQKAAYGFSFQKIFHLTLDSGCMGYCGANGQYGGIMVVHAPSFSVRANFEQNDFSHFCFRAYEVGIALQVLTVGLIKLQGVH